MISVSLHRLVSFVSFAVNTSVSMHRLVLAPLAFALLLNAAVAQSVRWEPAGGTLALNQVNELSLVFEQCEPSGTIRPPAISGLNFGAPSRSENTSVSVVNFQATTLRTVTLTYGARPTERRQIVIPEFTVDTDKGRQRVASVTFEVGDAMIGQTGLSIDQIAQARFTLPATVWAGEVFPLTYTLNASKAYLYNLNKDFEWDPAPLVHEPFPNPDQVDTLVNNDRRVSIVYKTRALAKTPGTQALNPATQLVNITTGSSGFGMFSRAALSQIAVSSPRVDLTVKPLPSPAPAGFSGAVGRFTLDSKVVPAAATVGEPITWTLTLEGNGNWPDIPGLPPRSVSKDFRVVQPQAKRTNKEGALFDANLTEDIILIPTKPGAYTLGPVTFAIFNPATGAYENLTTKPVTIRVSAAAAASLSPVPATPINPDAAPPSESVRPSTSDTRPAAVAPSTAIPRDPLPPAGTSLVPLSSRTLLVSILVSTLVPIATWFALALRRARQTDPARPLREARGRLFSTIGRISAGASPELLLAWQSDTALLHRLPRAVPTPLDFKTHPQAEAWSSLWSDADRALYGNTPLPSDWTTRAQTALAQHRVPAFSAFQLFLLRNLLPLAVFATIFLHTPPALAVGPEPAGADTHHLSLMDNRPLPAPAKTSPSATVVSEPSSTPPPATPADTYSKTDYSAAEAAWRDALAKSPTDWTAHHNLALALLQQNRPAEAAGHALAAFVQQPRNPSVRWHLVHAFQAAGTTPSAIAPFLTLDTPSPALSSRLSALSSLHHLARLASPNTWQLALIVAAWLGALALALGLQAAFQRRSRKRVTLPLVALSILLAAAASLSLRAYGPLADARAVVVVAPATLRSIPTDLDTQKTTTLSVGMLATADKSFLGWRRLAFPNGQTGWTRAEALVPLWTKP